MHWIILESKRTGQEFKQRTVDTNVLTIGRGTNQDVISNANSVALHHATLTPNLHNATIGVQAYVGTSVTVNGARKTSANIKVGDEVVIGDLHITINQISENGIQISVARIAVAATKPQKKHTLQLEDTWLSNRAMAWFGFILVALLFGVLPILAIYDNDVEQTLRTTPLPDVTVFDSGPVHKSHEHLQCNDCHAEPFALTKDEQCATCHAKISHHIPTDLRAALPLETTNEFSALGSVAAETLAAANPRLAEVRCATCHHEHTGSNANGSGLIRNDQALCSDCHTRLEQWITEPALRNVHDFATDHPEFRYTVFTRNLSNAAGSSSSNGPGDSSDSTNSETNTSNIAVANQDLFAPRRFDRGDNRIENSGLKFPHDIHLAPEGVKAPGGLEIMQCADCHTADKAGLNMLPIQMETQCERCHSLSFDSDNPARSVPHGEPAEVIATLTEYFSYKLLTGNIPASNNNNINSIPEFRRPGPNANRPISRATIVTPPTSAATLIKARALAAETMQELMEKRACDTCHEIAIDQALPSPQKWQVLRVELTDQWLPKAHFSHAAHEQTECSACHVAEPSKQATDVLMPGIDTCQECHGGGESQPNSGLITSDCLMCHSFHNQALEAMHNPANPAAKQPAQMVPTENTSNAGNNSAAIPKPLDSPP